VLMDNAVEVERLVVVRGGRRVLDDVTLTIRRGSVTGLLGPNGSGKTTLIRCLVGVQRITAGHMRVLGLPAGSAQLRPRIGYVTQSPAVYLDITVRENLRYFAAVLGVRPIRIEQVLDAVALRDVGECVVARLSGGQRARVSLAVALLGEPELLVLDEPTVGLDPLLRRDLWRLLHDIAAAGATLLVSSHVMDEARHCADLVLLRDGRLLARGTPDEILRNTGTTDLEDAFLHLVEHTPAVTGGVS
jgi:ABC-2 type transport system ATP-binding protein